MPPSDEAIQSHARVVIIGGGIFGVSILYHLAQEGWQDVVLLEKGELSSGTTWHAAGQCPHFIGDLNMARIHDHGIRMYKSLEEETGQATGWHTSGGIRLARHKEELDWHQHVAGIAKQVGVEAHVVGLDEIRELHPFLELHDVVGGTYTPHDGHTDPTSATNALAIGARQRGATIYRNTLVTGIEREGDEWKVASEKGDIRCEHLVLATGFFSDQVGSWLGLRLPFVNVVHQYLVTDPVQELTGRERELPVVRDPGSCSYMRQEQQGLLGGPYENRDLHTAYDDGVPWSFDQELIPPDLERISPWLEMMMERMPLFGTVGVRRIISGFIAHAPDLSPPVGPIAGHRNLWLAAGSAIGISQGPGCGKYLAQWMVHGAADISMLSLDPRRYGDVHTDDWVMGRTVEASMQLFDLHPPGHEFHAGRPLRMSPIHERLSAKGAVFGESMGWERPKWFAPIGVEETHSFSRSNAFYTIAQECRAVREHVGVLDLTSFTKLEVSGPDAGAFLNRILANRVPRRDGGIALCHLLTENGEIEAEMTVTRLTKDLFFLLSAGSMRVRGIDQLDKSRTESDCIDIADVTENFGCLAVTGPRSRDLLSKLTDTDLSNGNFRWMSAQQIEIAGTTARALRVSYAGELGWELYLPLDDMLAVYDALVEAGTEFGIADFGMYALNSLRMEKAYRAFGSELSSEVSLIEADMERFAAFDKETFVGRDAMLVRKQQGVQWKLAYLAVGADHLDVLGSEAIYNRDRVVGVVTSGGFGHTVSRNLAFSYVEPELAIPGTDLEVEMLGQRYPASVLETAVYDPGNQRPRMKPVTCSYRRTGLLGHLGWRDDTPSNRIICLKECLDMSPILRKPLDRETRSALLGTLDRLIRDEIAPRANEIDRTAEFPRDLYRRVGELGMLGLWVPEQYGGCGPELVTPLLVSERLAKVSVAFSISVSNCGDCVIPTVAAGTDWAKRTYLPGLVSGELIPCFCLSEPGGGSDVAAMTTKAVRDGEDYVISGRKMWITSASVTDVFVVFAKTDPDAGHKGITGFAIPSDAAGLTVGEPEELLGLRGSPTSEVIFDEVRVPSRTRLGNEGDGFALTMATLDESRLNIAAVSLGAAASAIDQAIGYARERVQFGRPIIEHQGLQFKISELATELAKCRSLWGTAVQVLVSEGGRRAGVYAAMSKLSASDLAMTAAIEAAQILGAYGLTKSYTVERLIRDCKALQIFEGTNEIQKWLIGRQIQKSGLQLDELETLSL